MSRRAHLGTIEVVCGLYPSPLAVGVVPLPRSYAACVPYRSPFALSPLGLLAEILKPNIPDGRSPDIASLSAYLHNLVCSIATSCTRWVRLCVRYASSCDMGRHCVLPVTTAQMPLRVSVCTGVTLMRPSQFRGTLIALLLLLSVSAETHAVFVKSLPARRAMLSKAPARVELWFNERLEVKFSQLSVWDAAGRQVDAQDVQVDPNDPQRLSVGLGDLAPGIYAVKFRVLSVDGHIVESEFPFTVRGRQ
jgi:copper resistance protein C